MPYGKNKQLGTFALPETFIDRLSRASIAYEVSVRFMRGKWRSDYRYVCGRPMCSSILR